MEIRLKQAIPTATVSMANIYLPMHSFMVFLRITDSSSSPPYTVSISEILNSPVGVPGLMLNGGPILQLAQSTTIYDPHNPLGNYNVNSLSSFEMRWSYISFEVSMGTEDAAVNAFKGSTMRIIVSNNHGYSESGEVNILNSDPNNHFHWRGQPTFVDGWYFKCVHVDEGSITATPFFFLYGVNNPSGGGSGAESFVVCSNAGSTSLSPGMVPTPGASPTLPDLLQDWRFSHGVFRGETFYGLDTSITSDFHATDRGCKGNKTFPNGDVISWDLEFTKIYTGCVTDWNPLEPLELLLKAMDFNAFAEFPSMPRMKYFKKSSMMSAYYMSHNMNSFVSGQIHWKGQTFVLNNDKGYQDENWGSGGFPHPYVWMQANNFFSGGTASPGTSLVAVFTPKMNVDTNPLWPGVSQAEIGGICFRYGGHKYEFMSNDSWPAVAAGDVSGVDIAQSSISCEVEFIQGMSRKRVNMSGINPSAPIGPTSIGPFVAGSGRSPIAYPVKVEMSGTNDAGDRISIVGEWPQSSVMRVAAPLGGRMTDFVTKETLQAEVTVVFTPSGGAPVTLVSYFGAFDYGD